MLKNCSLRVLPPATLFVLLTTLLASCLSADVALQETERQRRSVVFVPVDGTCADACGGYSADGCWCDHLCDDYGDCCPDVCDFACEDTAEFCTAIDCFVDGCGDDEVCVRDGNLGGRCVCDEGASAGSDGGCVNTWGDADVVAPFVVASTEIIERDGLSELRFGVPIPDGELKIAGACRIHDGQKMHAASCSPMTYWQPESKSDVKWLRVAALVDGIVEPNQQMWLHAFAGDGQQSLLSDPLELSLPPVAVVDGADVVIDTGPLSFTIGQREDGAIIHGFTTTVGDPITLPSDMLFSIEDDLGSIYQAVVVGKAKIEIATEQEAVVRLQCAFVDDEGENFQELVLRIHALRGAKSFTLEHTLVVTSNEMQTRGIGSVGVHMTSPNGQYSTAILGSQAALDRVVGVRELVIDELGINPRLFENGAQQIGVLDGAYVGLENDDEAVGIVVEDALQEGPKVASLVTVDGGGDRVSIDLWPASFTPWGGQSEDLMTLSPAQPGPLDLRNNFLAMASNSDEPTFFCLSPLDSRGDPLVLNLGFEHEVACVDFENMDDNDRAAFIEEVAEAPTRAIVFQGAASTPGAVEAFLFVCDDSCDDRQLIVDSRGFYNQPAQGMAKTHTLRVYAGGRDTHAAQDAHGLHNVGYDKRTAMASPDWVSQTDVFGAFSRASEFAGFDAYWQRVTTQDVDWADSNLMVGMLRHGNIINGHASAARPTDDDPALHAGFYNQESYDLLAQAWWVFLASGDEDAFRFAASMGRYHRDLLTVWANDDERFVGTQRRHSMLPYSNYAVNHTLALGQHMQALLTGDLRAKEALLAMGELAKVDYSDEHGIFAVTSMHSAADGSYLYSAMRSHTAPWLAASIAWQWTGENAYQDIISGFTSSLAEVQTPSGQLPTGIHAGIDTPVAAASASVGGSQHSIFLAIDSILRSAPNPALLSLNTDLARARLLGDREMTDSLRIRPIPSYILAYDDTQNPAFLLDALYLRDELAAESLAISLAREPLPHGVSRYLHRLAQFFDAGGDDEDILAAYSAMLLQAGEPSAPLLRQYFPIAAYVDEDVDQVFNFNAQARFWTKFYGVAFRAELRDVDGDLLFCRRYYNCGESDVVGGVCVLPNDADIEPLADGCITDESRVLVSTSLPDDRAVQYNGNRWDGDNIRITVLPDDKTGEYTFKTFALRDGLPYIGSASQLSRFRNVHWSFDTDLLSTESPSTTGVQHRIENDFLFLNTSHAEIALTSSDGTQVSLRSNADAFGIFDHDAPLVFGLWDGPGFGAHHSADLANHLDTPLTVFTVGPASDIVLHGTPDQSVCLNIDAPQTVVLREGFDDEDSLVSWLDNPVLPGIDDEALRGEGALRLLDGHGLYRSVVVDDEADYRLLVLGKSVGTNRGCRIRLKTERRSVDDNIVAGSVASSHFDLDSTTTGYGYTATTVAGQGDILGTTRLIGIKIHARQDNGFEGVNCLIDDVILLRLE